MRRLILIPLILLLLTACANNGDPISLPIPDVVGEVIGGGDQDQTAPPPAPVVQVTPTPPLPPTFTPDPMAHQGHLYLLPVSGADGRLQYVHVVRPGDTLSGLSKLYGVSLTDMARVNNISDQDLIRVGAILLVPLNGE